MASRVVMPKLTDTMQEGVLLKWYKKEGDPVESGDVLAEIETDKAIMDLEAYASGVLRKILVKSETTVPAGELLAIIAGKDEDISGLETKTVSSPPQVEGIKEKLTGLKKEKENNKEGEKNRDGGPMKVSPLAKKIAREKGIDLGKLKGSGPGGRIVEKDLKDFLSEGEKVQEVDQGFEIKPLSQMRKAIVRSMSRSKSPVPHFYVTSDIDVERLSTFRNELEKVENVVKVSLTDILIKACAIVLTKFPSINASFREDYLEYHQEVRIGVAVGLDDGIITPVVKKCESKTLYQIATETKELFQRARERKLSPEEYAGATFSISNLGQYDVDHFIAIITPPEAAVLAVGSIRHEPVVKDEAIQAGQRMRVTLSCDHRVVDGILGAKFLQELKKVLENPLLTIL